MSHSLRRAAHEPPGTFQTASGTRFTVYTNNLETWQRLEQAGERSEYRVDYVIGSGNHAFGYLVRIGDHLFQSPIGYYSSRHAYDLAPGYEKVPNPDFTRPVTIECLLCHSGKPLPIAGTVNRYESPAFAQEAISCERCHGPTRQHLTRPVPGSIINPAKLKGAARDSVCEQCHLSGVIRILNPGKQFEDFQPGQTLEDTFTVYRFAAPAGTPPGAFKVISHSEQLAASACARNSNGKLWCGTCHDPHDKPAQPASKQQPGNARHDGLARTKKLPGCVDQASLGCQASYYRARCLTCHSGQLSESHPAADGNCVECHMPRREVVDGGHTVFTDHRIMRKPGAQFGLPNASELSAWRDPPAEFAARNLALAYINAGVDRNLPTWIVRGYRMLTAIQTEFLRDPAVLRGFGTALLLGNQPHEAKIAFDRLLEIDPTDPVNEENAGRAELACGNVQAATKHLDRALSLDPLLLSSAEVLEAIYANAHDTDKQAALAERMREAMRNSASLPSRTRQ